MRDAPAAALAYVERLLPDLEANDLLNGATPADDRRADAYGGDAWRRRSTAPNMSRRTRPKTSR